MKKRYQCAHEHRIVLKRNQLRNIDDKGYCSTTRRRGPFKKKSVKRWREIKTKATNGPMLGHGTRESLRHVTSGGDLGGGMMLAHEFRIRGNLIDGEQRGGISALAF